MNKRIVHSELLKYGTRIYKFVQEAILSVKKDF